MKSTSMSSRVFFLFVLSVVGLPTRSIAEPVEYDWVEYDWLDRQQHLGATVHLMSGSASFIGINIASITVSQKTDGVPCFGCVPNAGHHVALPIPWQLIPTGGDWSDGIWSTVLVINSSLPEGAGGCRVSMSWLDLESQKTIYSPDPINFPDCSAGIGLVNFTDIKLPPDKVKTGDAMVIATVKVNNATQSSRSELIKILNLDE